MKSSGWVQRLGGAGSSAWSAARGWRFSHPKRMSVTCVCAVGLAIWASPDLAQARDLESAARSYASTVKNLGQIVGVAGIGAGGLMMALPGVNRFGRDVLAAGLIGTVCSFGAPAFISFLTNVFGG